jgi:hypothetical protein
MSSYARYCRDQAAECARRARLATSREIAANCLKLELRWIKLAEKATATEGLASAISQPLRSLTDALKVPDAPRQAARRGRVVEIDHDPSDDVACIVKDARTGHVLLRQRDSARLHVMCQRLGWRVVADGTTVPRADRRSPTAETGRFGSNRLQQYQGRLLLTHAKRQEQQAGRIP